MCSRMCQLEEQGCGWVMCIHDVDCFAGEQIGGMFGFNLVRVIHFDLLLPSEQV